MQITLHGGLPQYGQIDVWTSVELRIGLEVEDGVRTIGVDGTMTFATISIQSCLTFETFGHFVDSFHHDLQRMMRANRGEATLWDSDPTSILSVSTSTTRQPWYAVQAYWHDVHVGGVHLEPHEFEPQLDLGADRENIYHFAVEGMFMPRSEVERLIGYLRAVLDTPGLVLDEGW